MVLTAPKPLAVVHGKPAIARVESSCDSRDRVRCRPVYNYPNSIDPPWGYPVFCRTSFRLFITLEQHHLKVAERPTAVVVQEMAYTTIQRFTQQRWKALLYRETP